MKSSLDQILDEKPGWRKAFNAMPITGNCDSGCGKPATMWFGNTSCATCGANKCIDIQQAEYDSNVRRDEEEDERW